MECVNQKRLLYEPKMTKRLLAWHRGDPLEETVEEDSIHGKLYFQPHRVQCECCGKMMEDTAEWQMDHILELADIPEGLPWIAAIHFWSLANCQILCLDCHKAKSVAEHRRRRNGHALR